MYLSLENAPTTAILYSANAGSRCSRTKDILKQERFSDPAQGRKYINSYEDMDFDYEAYFRKTRYYGAFLPIIMTIITIILIAFFLIGAFLPRDFSHSFYDSSGLKIDTLFYFKLGRNELDYRIDNTGDWPDGDWRVQDKKQQRLTYGEPYIDPETQEAPEHVYLYSDLGLRTININTFDIVKAWFYTKMLASVRLDFLEDRAPFQGISWFYTKYMHSAEENIAYLRNEDGSFDFSILIKSRRLWHDIKRYYSVCALGGILVINIGRIFSYTSRRLHILHFLCCSSACTVILPALRNGDRPALKNYFCLTMEFMTKEQYTLCSVHLRLCRRRRIFTVLPKIFKNRLKKAHLVPKETAPEDIWNIKLPNLT